MLDCGVFVFYIVLFRDRGSVEVIFVGFRSRFNFFVFEIRRRGVVGVGGLG